MFSAVSWMIKDRRFVIYRKFCWLFCPRKGGAEDSVEEVVEVGVKVGVEALPFRLFTAGSSSIWVIISSVLLVTEFVVDLVNSFDFARRCAMRLLWRNGFTSVFMVDKHNV